MQERTKREIEILKQDTYNKTKKKWRELDEKRNKEGMYHSSAHIDEFFEIGFNYINEVFDKFFDIEKNRYK